MDNNVYQNFPTLFSSQQQYPQAQNARPLFSEPDLNYQKNSFPSGHNIPENPEARSNVGRLYSDSSYRQSTVGIGPSLALGNKETYGKESVNQGGQNAFEDVIRRRIMDQDRGSGSGFFKNQVKTPLLPTPTIGVVNAHYQDNHAIYQPGYSRQIDQLNHHTGQDRGSIIDHDMRRYQDVDLRLASDGSFSVRDLENSPLDGIRSLSYVGDFNGQKRRKLCDERFPNARSPFDYNRLSNTEMRDQDGFERSCPQVFEREVLCTNQDNAWAGTIIPERYCADVGSHVVFDDRHDRSRSPNRFNRDVDQDQYYGSEMRPDGHATNQDQHDLERNVLIRTSSNQFDMNQDRDLPMKRPRSPERYYGDRSQERFVREVRPNRSPDICEREGNVRSQERFDRGSRLGRSPVRFDREKMNRNQDRFDRGNRAGRSPVRFDRDEINRNQDRFDRGNRPRRSPVQFDREEINRSNDRFDRGNRSNRSPFRFGRDDMNRTQDRFDRGVRPRSADRFGREEVNRIHDRFDRGNKVDRPEMCIPTGKFDQENRKGRFEEIRGTRDFRDEMRSPNKLPVERARYQERFGRQEKDTYKERSYQRKMPDKEERINQDVRPQVWNRNSDRCPQGKIQNVNHERTYRERIDDRRDKRRELGRLGNQNRHLTENMADGEIRHPDPLASTIRDGTNGRDEMFPNTKPYIKSSWLNAPAMLAGRDAISNLLNAARDSIATFYGSNPEMEVARGGIFTHSLTENKVQPFDKKERKQFQSKKFIKGKGLAKPLNIPPETIFYGNLAPESYDINKDSRDNAAEVETVVHNVNNEFQIIGKKRSDRFTKFLAHSLNKLDISKLDDIPVFYDITWDTGKLTMFAKNSKSVDWLQDCLSNDKTLGTGLKLIPKYDMHKANLFIPGDTHQVFPKELLARFSRQNPHLKCYMWRILSVKPLKNGMSCVFGIDNESKEMLKSSDCYAYYGIEKILFDFKPTETKKMKKLKY